MALTDDNLFTLSEYLKNTLNPDEEIRRTAENFLKSVELNKNYPILLLHLVDKSELDMSVRVAASIALKNFVKRYWKTEDLSVNKIDNEDRVAIKKFIINLMLRSPDSIQKQLSDAVSVIGKHDFPAQWPELIDQMVEKFNTGDFHIINGVLHTAHSLFKRYRYEFKSQVLWTEIKYVLDEFAKPLTELFLATMNLTQVHSNYVDALKVIYNSLTIICKVFYSLNFQDLPEFFEDNMALYMSNFHTLLTVNVPSLKTRDDEEAGVIEQLKSQVCDNVCLYAQKYDEEFQPFLPQFVTAIWNLLTTTGQQPKYDALVSNALQFLATVADRAQYRHLFEDPNTLSSICEKIIIPNMEFRESDNELFEDNPEEYIRRDIEGSDVDTRRRAACNLVKVLSKYFEAKIMEIFGAYIHAMLQNYMAKPAENWRSKDAAIYLITSSASKGQTQKHGVTQSSDLVPLPQFAAQHIETELNKPDVNEFPVLKADAIKFIMIFRSILPGEQVAGSLPQMIRHLDATSPVVHSYAACAIEKILLLKTQGNMPLVTLDTEIAEKLIKSLFQVFRQPVRPLENEFVMKAIMRVFASLEDKAVHYSTPAMENLLSLLAYVANNPSRPNFNHYLFETLSIIIKRTCMANPDAIMVMEMTVFPHMQKILEQDVQEFIPYVFQILAMLLEIRKTYKIGARSTEYMELFPCLLAPVLFEKQGNIHPLNRLLQAFVTNGLSEIIAQDKISGLLGVFQKLIASKANDHEGFSLIQTIIEYFPQETLKPYIKQVFILLFQRLSLTKTTKFVKGLIVLFCFYAIRNGPMDLVSIIDSIQPQMFGMVIERVFITDLQKVSGEIERKITAIGVSNILTTCSSMLENPYVAYYPRLLASLIEFLELPHDETQLPEDLQNFEMDDTTGYQAAYSQLIFASKAKRDPLASIYDVRVYLAKGLGAMEPNQLRGLLGQIPEPNAAHLRNYLQTAGITVA